MEDNRKLKDGQKLKKWRKEQEVFVEGKGNRYYVRKERKKERSTVRGKQRTKSEWSSISEGCQWFSHKNFYGASTCSCSFDVPVPGPPSEANHFICLFDSSQLPFTEGLYHFYHNGLAKARRKRSLHHQQLLERDPRVSFPIFQFLPPDAGSLEQYKESRQGILK